MAVVITFIGEMVVLAGSLIPFFVRIKKLTDGMKCQLRSEMLRTYYHNQKSGKIRQFEYENFVANYEAYKALGGNSFIDKIYSELKSWEILT